MDKNDVLLILNTSIVKKNKYDVISAYLVHKGVESWRIQEFNKLLLNSMLVFSGIECKCYMYAADYFMREFNINRLTKENNIISYY